MVDNNVMTYSNSYATTSSYHIYTQLQYSITAQHEFMFICIRRMSSLNKIEKYTPCIFACTKLNAKTMYYMMQSKKGCS